MDRCIVDHRAESIELHVFSDASEKAYGSSIYLKSISTLREVEVSLVTSKCRLSPINRFSFKDLNCAGMIKESWEFVEKKGSWKRLPYPTARSIQL
ncbi:hypothetical protein TNCV_581871 [Trichonephila clavipes]|nr:hypothetical protein TNCV_581871 [Trichonephila clavipes]